MLAHIAIYTGDLERSRAFYAKYFGGEANALYHNPNTGLRTYFLRWRGGARLELMQRPGLAPGADGPHLGYAHMAFELPDRGAVDALTERLRADGYPVLSGPRVTGDGYYESCVADPDGNPVELVARRRDSVV